MRKLLRIAWQTYAQRITAPWFLLLYFGLPLFYLLLVGVFSLLYFQASRGDRRPLGIVDQANIIRTWPAPTPGEVALQPFGAEAAASQALARGEIQAYYLIAPDYIATGDVTEVGVRPVQAAFRAQLAATLRDQLLSQTPPERHARLTSELSRSLAHRTLDATDFALQYELKTSLTWGMFGLFMILSTLTSFFLMDILSEEHTNRTAEILLSSLSAEQLLAGKVLGIVALGLTPVLVWSLPIGLALPFAKQLLLSQLGLDLAVRMPWGFLALCLALFLPAYAQNAVVAALTGAVVGNLGQGYRVVTFVTGAIPSLLWAPAALIAFSAPDAPASVLLSLVPLTAPMVVSMRVARIVVPPWQIAASLGGLYLTLALTVRYSARLYRASWLMAGQKNRLWALWQALRGR